MSQVCLLHVAQSCFLILAAHNKNPSQPCELTGAVKAVCVFAQTSFYRPNMEIIIVLMLIFERDPLEEDALYVP